MMVAVHNINTHPVIVETLQHTNGVQMSLQSINHAIAVEVHQSGPKVVNWPALATRAKLW